ncbi:MAG: FeoB small GTPase domain-containing protein, partial [Terriglobales bacterium]
PNVGKSVIFNALTGLSADVSNYPGTTIDVARGKAGDHDLADTPGVYGVSSFNDEERAARLMILEAEVIVNVVSALSLDRDLFLTLQLIDLGKPMLLVLNQWDEAKARGMRIDTARLGEFLSIPVLTCVAVRKEGIADILEHLPRAALGSCSEELQKILKPLLDKGIERSHAILIAEGDELSATIHGVEPLCHRAEIYKTRRKRVNELVQQCVKQDVKGLSFGVRLGRVLLHPFYGTLISIAVCYLIFYQLLGVWIAGNLVDLTEKQLMKPYYEGNVRKIAAMVFPCEIKIGDQEFLFPNGTAASPLTAGAEQTAMQSAKYADVSFDFWKFRNPMSAVGNILVGEYGLVTLTVTYLLGLLFPLVLGFYLGLS